MVRWLVIGIGDITRRRVIPAILLEPRSRLQAVLTRDPQKAAAFNGTQVFTTLEDALRQSSIDPERFFGVVQPKNRIPRNNVLLIGGICLIGAMVFSYQLGTELLNYGALLAFMGVNVAAMLQAWKEGKFRLWFPMVVGICGFITCGFLWLNLGLLARIVGSIWASLGMLLWLVRRRYTYLPGADLSDAA